MISKEEIEEYKETLEDLTKDENVYNSIKRAVNGTFEYIQQLETKEQKVIEKLERDIKIYSQKGCCRKQVREGIVREAKEILKIVKGEE